MTLTPRRTQATPLFLWAALAAAVGVMGGCSRDGVASLPTAALVNKAEISMQQIELAVGSQTMAAEPAGQVAKEALERLIDQELAQQKSRELQLDRDPRVVQQLEAATRQLLARAFLDKIGGDVPPPTAEAVARYYDEQPALFKERRIYTLQEVAIQARSDQIDLLRATLKSSANINAFLESLTRDGFRYTTNQAVRSAAQLPLGLLGQFARMKEGESIFIPTPSGPLITVLAAARSEPMDKEQARVPIEQFLLADAKRKAVEASMLALRAQASIRYQGPFAASGAAK